MVGVRIRVRVRVSVRVRARVRIRVVVAEALPLRLAQGVVGYLRLLLALVGPHVEARVDRRGSDAGTGAVVPCASVRRADKVRRQAGLRDE